MPSLSIGYIGFNWSTPPFDDVRMRQALALALDKTQFVPSYQGKGTNHIVPDGMPSYSNPHLTGPRGTTSLTGNVTLARQLAASYAADTCGGRLSNCAPITLSYLPGFDNEAALARSDWQQAFPGLRVNLDQTNVDPHSVKPSPQAWLSGWTADYPDPQDFLSLQFLPEQFNLNDVPADANASVYNLLRQADVELDPTVRMNDYEEAEQMLVNLVAWIPLDQFTDSYVVQNYVANYRVTEMGSVSLDTWQNVYILNHPL